MKTILLRALICATAFAAVRSVQAATITIPVSDIYELTNALATVTVDTNNSYTVTLAEGTYDLTAIEPMSANALLAVSTSKSRTLILQGDPEVDREKVVLDAKGTGRIIELGWEGSCTLKHLTLKNGKGGGGSAVYIIHYSSYYFRDCVFRGNAGSGGGALTSANNSQDTKFYDCLIENTYITGSYGGSLFTHPKTVSGCTFRANTNNCDQSTSLLALPAGTTVTNCVFVENAVPGRWSTGGTLRISGGLVACCVFSNNTAGANAGGGAAVCLAGKTDVRNCTFHGNRYTVSSSYGGAIYSSSVANTNAVISGCEFTDNRANGYSSVGGAIASFPGLITNCTFVGNQAYYGGAVYDCSNVVDCVFARNHSSGVSGKLGGGVAYKSVIRDSVATNNTAEYQVGGFYDCRVYRCVVGGHLAVTSPTERTQEGMETYYEDCEMIGGSPFGICFNNCGFNRCYLHDYCATNAVLGNGNGHFFSGRIAVTNCLIRNIYSDRLISGYAANFTNAMVNTTIIDCTYNNLATDVTGSGPMAFVNNLFWGIKTRTWASDDDVAQLFTGMTFTNNFISTYQPIKGEGNLNCKTDKTLKPSLMGDRDPAHPYAPRRRSILVGAGVVQDWMAGATDLAGQERLTDGKVAIGAYETTDRGPFPGLTVILR